MSRIYRDDDIDLQVLSGRTVGVIGYGNQGRAQALNLRDSGFTPLVAGRDDEYGKTAVQDGFTVHPITHGFFGQLKLHSQTSQYGQLSRLDRMMTPELLARIEAVVDEIASGRFHAEWVAEQQAGKPNMRKLWQQALEHPLATSEAKLEALRKVAAESFGGSR